jgi:hypothetical protein
MIHGPELIPIRVLWVLRATTPHGLWQPLPDGDARVLGLQELCLLVPPH